MEYLDSLFIQRLWVGNLLSYSPSPQFVLGCLVFIPAEKHKGGMRDTSQDAIEWRLQLSGTGWAWIWREWILWDEVDAKSRYAGTLLGKKMHDGSCITVPEVYENTAQRYSRVCKMCKPKKFRSNWFQVIYSENVHKVIITKNSMGTRGKFLPKA